MVLGYKLEYALILHNDVFTIEGNKGIKSYKYSVPFNFQTVEWKLHSAQSKNIQTIKQEVYFILFRSTDFILSKHSLKEKKKFGQTFLLKLRYFLHVWFCGCNNWDRQI